MMKLVVDYLTSARRRMPTAMAVSDGIDRLSYAEMDALSDRLAAGLQALDVTPGERIGLYLPKSISAIAAIYATLKAGGCYVPLGLENPLSRLSKLLQNCGVRRLVTETALGSEAEQALRRLGVEIITVAALAAAGGQTAFAPVPLEAQAAAAILHTSGSTGQPKGAVITQANLAVFVAWALQAFDLRPEDRLLSHAPLHFDLSFFDLFAAAGAAAAVVLATPAATANAVQLARLVNQTGVSVWQSTPSALTLQTIASRQSPAAMPGVRCVLFAGERLPRQTLLKLPAVFPQAQFYNIYGCTETNDTFIYRLPQPVAQAPEPLPIGAPLPYIRYRIVDETGNDVAPGQQGQLLVAGATVMAGYLTSSAAGLSPVDGGAGDGFYRTRDIVSIAADGCFYFHGRVDAIIKSNGYRVNLLEIEDHLGRSEQLAEVALLSLPDELIGNRIVAVVRPQPGQPCSTLELKLYCAAALPKYAIPQSFYITHAVLPKGSTGKVDKRLLAQLWRQASSGKSTDEGSVSHECA